MDKKGPDMLDWNYLVFSSSVLSASSSIQTGRMKIDLDGLYVKSAKHVATFYATRHLDRFKNPVHVMLNNIMAYHDKLSVSFCFFFPVQV